MKKQPETIEELKEMPKDDGYAKPKTIGELEGMLGECW